MSKINWGEKFKVYNDANPEVYELFKKFTFETITKGFKNFGSQTVINRIRWYTDVETKNDQFKINSNYSAYYARLFMRDFPQYAGFFRTRNLATERF